MWAHIVFSMNGLCNFLTSMVWIKPKPSISLLQNAYPEATVFIQLVRFIHFIYILSFKALKVAYMILPLLPHPTSDVCLATV